MSDEYESNRHPFDERELKFGQYVVAHRTVWKRALVFFLYFATLAIVYLFAVKWIFFLTGSLNIWSVEYDLTYNSIPWKEIREANSPKPPYISSIYAVASGDESIDIMARINNPNTEWRASRIDYRFSVDGKPQSVSSTFLLPGNNSLISEYNISTQNKSPTIRVDILDIVWKRVRDREPLKVLEELSVADVTFENDINLNSFEVEATLLNTSGRGFWVVGLQAVAKRFGDVAGINYIAVEQVRSGSARDVVFSWTSTLSGIDEVEVIPIVDVYNDSVYMPLRAGDFMIDPSGPENVRNGR